MSPLVAGLGEQAVRHRTLETNGYSLDFPEKYLGLRMRQGGNAETSLAAALLDPRRISVESHRRVHAAVELA